MHSPSEPGARQSRGTIRQRMESSNWRMVILGVQHSYKAQLDEISALTRTGHLVKSQPLRAGIV